MIARAKLLSTSPAQPDDCSMSCLYRVSSGIEFSKEPIVRDVSQGWNVNIGYTDHGIAEITILDAKAAGYWPLENAEDLLPVAA